MKTLAMTSLPEPARAAVDSGGVRSEELLVAQMGQVWRALSAAGPDEGEDATCRRLTQLAARSAGDLDNRIRLLEPVLAAWGLRNRLAPGSPGRWSSAIDAQELPPCIACDARPQGRVTLGVGTDGRLQLSGQVIQPAPCRGQQVCVLACEAQSGKAVLVWLTPSQRKAAFPSADVSGRLVQLRFDAMPIAAEQRWTLAMPFEELADSLHRSVAVGLCGLLVGALGEGLDRVAEFTRLRVLYGKPIAELPLVQADLGRASRSLARLDALWGLTLRTSARAPAESAFWKELCRYTMAWQGREALQCMTKTLGARHYLREGEYAPVHLLCQGMRSFSIRFGGHGSALWPWVEGFAQTGLLPWDEQGPDAEQARVALAGLRHGMQTHRTQEPGFCETWVREFSEACLALL